MNPQKKFHIVFSFIMGAIMVFIMTFVITFINIGFADNFLTQWGKAFAIAYVIVVPILIFLAPQVRKLTSKLLNIPH